MTFGRMVRKLGLRIPIVCMDTWLGDVHMWHVKGDNLGHQADTGEPRLFEQFMSNIKHKNYTDLVLPLRAPAMVGLRYLQTLVERRKIPPPNVIYLDTAHEYPETEMEMQFAWRILAPGGILTGDDYDKFWPSVQQSVNEFASRLTSDDAEEPAHWAPKVLSAGMLKRVKQVELLDDPPDRRMSPLLIREPSQWLLMKKGASSAQAPLLSAKQLERWRATIKRPVRCCLAGWADPMPHSLLGDQWCSSGSSTVVDPNFGVTRHAACARSAKLTTWYSRCATRRAQYAQPTCHPTFKYTCNIVFACRPYQTTIYNTSGRLSQFPDRFEKPRGFS